MAGPPAIGLRRASLRKQQRQRQCADGADDPADHREAADAGERGRQQEDARADHVAGDDNRGEHRPELAMAGH